MIIVYVQSILDFVVLKLFSLYRLIERSLGKFVDENKANLLKEKKLPIDGCVTVAGRTDKGVTALEQVCSFCMFSISICIYLSMFLTHSQTRNVYFIAHMFVYLKRNACFNFPEPFCYIT